MKHNVLSILLPLMALLLAITGCSTPADPPTSGSQANTGTCLDCHTNQTMLKTLAIPDDPGSENSGEG
jgi:hypothetical protein